VHSDSWRMKNQLDVTCYFYFTSYALNMFRTFIYPSSAAWDYSADTTPTQPHRICNTHRTKNNTTNVVIQQNSRKLLMMDIFMSETCWAHKKWNKNNKWHEVGLLFFNYVYVNLPIQAIIRNTKFWLNKHINNSELIEQTLYMFKRSVLSVLMWILDH